MANTLILIKKSAEPGGVPSSLDYGELALNYRDGKLFYKNHLGAITPYGGAGGASDSFATINSNSTLILATSSTDTLTFIPGDNISISTDALEKSITIAAKQQLDEFARQTSNAAFIQANASFEQTNVIFSVTNTAIEYATSAGLYANSAFETANAALNDISIIVGINETQNTNIELLNGINETQNTNITNVGTYANGAFNEANTAHSAASQSQTTADFAYNQANNATNYASSAGSYANSAFQSANAAAIQAQSSYDSANTKLPLTGGTITGNLNVEGRANVYSQLEVGTGSYVILPNTIAQFTGNTYLYSQVNQQNIDGHGTADFVVTANNGTDLINYLDMGIAGSQYDNTNYNSWNFVNPNDGFIMLQGNDGQDYGGNLYIGTTGSGQFVTGTEKADIVFIQGSNEEEVARFVLKQGLVIKTNKESYNVSTGSLVINGGAGISGSLYAGNIYDNGIHIKTYVDNANTFLQANDLVTLQSSLSYTDASNNVVQGQIAHLVSVNDTQNTNINSVNSHSFASYVHANSAFDKANTTGLLAQNAYDVANTKYASSGGIISGDVTITGNLVITGTQTVQDSKNISLNDNMLYLNSPISANVVNAVGNGTYVVYTTDANHGYVAGETVSVSGITPSSFNISGASNTTIFSVTSNTFTVSSSVTDTYVSGGVSRMRLAANPDIGFSAGYNDGSYHHTGLFRDASDGIYKFYYNYEPEPDGLYIDINDPTFRIASLTANIITDVISVRGVDPLEHAEQAFNKANSAVQTAWTTITANGISVAPTSNVDTLTLTTTKSNGVRIDASSNPDTIDFGLENSGVTSGTYGGSTNIPVLTVDTFGRVTSAANTSVSTTINLSANSGTGSVVGGGTLSIIGNTGISTYSTGSNIYINNTGVTSLATASSNRISISQTTGGVTVDLSSIDGLSAGTYTYPLLQVDSYGRITSISSQSVSGSWFRKTSGYTANTGDNIIADTTGGTFTINLPLSPTVGQTVVIADGGDWTANNLIVGRNGSTIEGLTDDVTMNIGGVQVTFVYDGTTWHVYASVGPEELPPQIGNSGKYLTTDGNTAIWSTVTLPSGQTSGSSTAGYLQYNGTTKAAGQLDGGTSDPSNTTRLNYDGHLYATKFYGDGSSLTGISAGATVSDDTTTNATRYIVWEDVTSGTSNTLGVSSSKLYFNPNTGTLSATIFNSLSDATLKDNVKPLNYSVDDINPVEFNWKDSGKKSFGVIAQDIEQVFPHMVETNDMGIKSVSYSQIIPLLVKEIQELKKEIATLKGKK